MGPIARRRVGPRGSRSAPVCPCRVRVTFASCVGGTRCRRTWGTFEFTVDLAPYDGQRVALLVFESSPKDGSQRNVVEVPVDVAG
jgi:hypothetical protein